MSDLRQRKKADAPPTPAKSPAALAKEEDSSSLLLDVFRALTFLIICSCALSYFVTRNSVVWGLQRPNWTRVDVVRSWIVFPPFPLHPLSISKSYSNIC
jgi:hypothetical protein